MYVTPEQAIAEEDKRLHVLKGMSGVVKPKEFVCIMGPSGGGKTSFLRALSYRADWKCTEIQGDVKWNGSHVKDTPYRQLSSFVNQADVLWEMLTPFDILVYKARLVLDISLEEAEEIANDLIAKMQLQRCWKTTVGKIDQAGISGGERRRTSIAIELVKKPSVLFLDEALSGLDSETVRVLMTVFKSLDCTVILTVHQPNHEAYSLFDKLLLISNGCTCYYGLASEAQSFLEQSGYQYRTNSDISEFIMESISRKVEIDDQVFEEPEDQFKDRISELKAKHEEQYQIPSLNKELEDLSSPELLNAIKTQEKRR